VVDIDRATLDHRMRRYFDPKVTHEQMRVDCPCAMKDTKRFEAKKTREQLQSRGMHPGYLVRFVYRPFDLRWVYWEPETKLLGEKSPHYFPHVFTGNHWFTAAQKSRRDMDPPIITPLIGLLAFSGVER
jgi:hypothetical protein